MVADWITIVMVRHCDTHLHPFQAAIRHQTLLRPRVAHSPRCSAGPSWWRRQHDAGDLVVGASRQLGVGLRILDRVVQDSSLQHNYLKITEVV
jgi:hypothetical protein